MRWAVTRERCDVAIVGSGFSGSLMARVLAVLGYDVVLLERGAHPRFAIGESTTPLANLSLERLGRRHSLADCYRLAAHGRWLEHYPDLRRGLKRGFTFYRHHPGAAFADRGFDSERLLVAASPNDAVADTHWVRADVDHHFVRQAVAAGVDYRDRTELATARFAADRVHLSGSRAGEPIELDAAFVIDASGPGGFVARQLDIPSGLDNTETRSALVFSHFTGVGSVRDVAQGLRDGPYPDDWAAVHHLIDEGWMYSLRFDDGVTSAGFSLTPRGLASLGATRDPDQLWALLLERYPTIGAVFGDATPVMPIRFVPARCSIGSRKQPVNDGCCSRTRTGSSTRCSRQASRGDCVRSSVWRSCSSTTPRAEAVPNASELAPLRRGCLPWRPTRSTAWWPPRTRPWRTSTSSPRTPCCISPPCRSPRSSSVSRPTMRPRGTDSSEWGMRCSSRCLARVYDGSGEITHTRGNTGSEEDRRRYVEWATAAIAPRNVAGLADPTRHNLYPVDLDVLIERHSLLEMTRDQLVEALPALRGMAPEPVFADRRGGGRSTSPPGPRATARQAPAPR